MSHERLSAFRVMWLLVFFDLPTDTAKQRKDYARFRKELLNDGFTMLQFSVYKRHCASPESADTHTRRIKMFLPPNGQISILRITDFQYGEILNFWGREPKTLEGGFQQLEFF